MTAKPNNSMDVRAKQRLCYRVVFLTQTGLVAVSPHVISTVRLLSLLRIQILEVIMVEMKDIESLTIGTFSFLKDYGFHEPLLRPNNLQSRVSYLAENIGIEVELDWRDMWVFVLIVRLESGKLPNGYYVSNTDGKICRIHLQKVLYNLGYRDEQINAERIYKKQKKKKQKPPSVEGMQSQLEADSNLLKKTIDLIISKQESIFTEGAI